MTLLKRNETPLQPQKGIATRNGIPVAIQVKFSGGPYPDRMSSDGRIDHIGEGRSGRQVPLRGNKAMLAAEQLCTRIPVYEKVQSNAYRLLGEYVVHSHRIQQLDPKADRDWIGYVFTLDPAG
jgi:hypothetical protein